MQLFVPQLNTIFVPIPKNASTALTRAITTQYPETSVVGPFHEARRAVMWRDPRERLISSYCAMRGQGMDDSFAKWVTNVCLEGFKQGFRDPHLKRQLDFCDNPAEIFYWDFDAFRRFFRLKGRGLDHVNESQNYECVWDERAEMAFQDAYSADLHVWQRGTGTYVPKWVEKPDEDDEEEYDEDEELKIRLEDSRIDQKD